MATTEFRPVEKPRRLHGLNFFSRALWAAFPFLMAGGSSSMSVQNLPSINGAKLCLKRQFVHSRLCSGSPSQRSFISAWQFAHHALNITTPSTFQALSVLNGRIKKPQKFHKNRSKKSYLAGSYPLQSATPPRSKIAGGSRWLPRQGKCLVAVDDASAQAFKRR